MLATVVTHIDIIPSNTPTSYLHHVSKDHNRFSGSISPKMSHGKDVENQLRSDALLRRLRD